MILDTNAVSALLAGDPALEAVLAGEERHELPVIVIGEYRYGLQRSRARARLEPLLEALIEESGVLSISEATTRHYARVRESLRAAGKPIPENDVWIAALAAEHGLAVVTRDRDFDRVEGLTCLGW